MYMVSGKFITFEGSEGCGKSTQVRRLCRFLEEAGHSVLTVREPGGTPLSEELRHLLKFAKASKGMTPEAELLLFAASRAQLTREVILPALGKGQVVLADRYKDSTTVYQGVARKIPMAIVEAINSFACGECRPDLTLVLDMDSEKSMARAMRRVRATSAQPDRMEQESHDFYRAGREGYLKLAQVDPERIRVLDADRPESDIAEEIRRLITEKFHGLS